VVALLAVVLAAGPARASATVAPFFAVTNGTEGAGLRPGLRVGYEPVPAAALEAQGDVALDGGWSAGLALTGRGFFGSASDGEGLFGLGRFGVGMGGQGEDFGPWLGLFGGFGARPVPGFEVAVSTGPEFVLASSARLRSELTLTWVIGPDTFGGGPGRGSMRHHPREVPKE
jgi:hypothetical protein